MTADVLAEMEVVREDLFRARYFPDEDVLDYALRRVSRSEWPPYIPIVPERGGLSTDKDVHQRFEELIKEMDTASSQLLFLKDYSPYYSAFCLARKAKNIAFRIGVWLAGIAFMTLLCSFVFGLPSPITFIIAYITLSLSFEVGVVALIFRHKQRQVETKLLPEKLTPPFEAYEMTKNAKYCAYMIALALLLTSFLVLAVPQQSRLSFVICYVCLCLAGQAGIIGFVLQRKEWQLRNRLTPIPRVETP